MLGSIVIFEVLTVLLFVISILHASKRGKPYVIELIMATVYGFLLEILTMIQLKFYTYGDFLLKVHGAPIAIALGWGVIIYTAMATVDRLGVEQKVRPFMAALLALNIDISMDAIAIREGFWTWGETGPWFGVPLGNFFAWFLVIFSFSYFVYYFRKTKRMGSLYPILCMGLSLVVLLVLDGIWYFYLSEPAHFFVLANMLSLSSVYVILNRGALKTDNEFDWRIFLVPLVFHIFFLILLLSGSYFMVELAAISIAMLIAGLLIHLLPSFERIRNSFLS